MSGIKSFFKGEAEEWTPAGLEIQRELYLALKPVFEDWVKEQGYSAREFKEMANDAAQDIVLDYLLSHRAKVGK